jgi:hypothetical protein
MHLLVEEMLELVVGATLQTTRILLVSQDSQILAVVEVLAVSGALVGLVVLAWFI